MSTPVGQITAYPLLEALLKLKGLVLKGIYTIREVAEIFGVSKRTIQDWVHEGRMTSRNLPGRGRFLAADLEAFLQSSVRIQATPDQGDFIAEQIGTTFRPAKPTGRIGSQYRAVKRGASNL